MCVSQVVEATNLHPHGGTFSTESNHIAAGAGPVPSLEIPVVNLVKL